MLDEIARIVSAGKAYFLWKADQCLFYSRHTGEMEAEFSKAFSGSNPLTASSMVKRWGTADTEIEKFLRKINELYMISVKGVAAKSSTTGSIDLRHLVKLLKQLL